MIAIAIPCVNEAHRLSPGSFVSFLAGNADLYFIFVDDGSTDQAAAMIYQIPLQRRLDAGESKIDLAYLPKIPVELFRIYWKYRKDLH